MWDRDPADCLPGRDPVAALPGDPSGLEGANSPIMLGFPMPPRQRRVLHGPKVLPAMPGEMNGGTSSMSWGMANPFLQRTGYLTCELGVTPALPRTKTYRALLSTLRINSRRVKNSPG